MGLPWCLGLHVGAHSLLFSQLYSWLYSRLFVCVRPHVFNPMPGD